METGTSHEPAAVEAVVSSLPPFLRLCREIRDLIYLAVLGSADRAPVSSSACGPRLDLGYQECLDAQQLELCQHKQPPLDYGTLSQWNRYSKASSRVNSRSLLYLNHQIHVETLEAISRIRASGSLKYSLDCIIENEWVIYPTWLSVPAVSSHVDVVEAQIRAVGDWTEKYKSGWRAGCGEYAHIIWSLLELLQRFLVRGPDFLSQPKQRGLAIGTLVLTVLTPDEPECGFLPVEHHIGSSSNRSHGLIHPGSVANMLHLHMDTLLCYACGGVTERHRTGYRVMKLGDYIDRIEIRLDGNERSSWTLKELLYKSQWN
ncbi:hypothetical protein ONS95_009217 [Cadophora gregata]|uniref:uncharacterized protein n=1 Tax=Cadophora gregata TaxID=51156 RepID=UPI0026DCA3AF|nr:uncharacterized protein ONS95_009217 [Cadophora gregata]KAK0124242.1 hypothetical protein ONS95_009217 [Cadophora gregata]KAK0129905.1 hypothetical protein ONS96_000450 [Cadophora gregata f. sp. sojae]